MTEPQPPAPVVAVVPGQGWTIRRKLEGDQEATIHPVIGFAIDSDGMGTPIIADEGGVVYAIDGGGKGWLFPPPSIRGTADVSTHEATHVAMIMLGMATQVDHVLALPGIDSIDDPGGILVGLRNLREQARRYTSAANRMMGG